MAISQKGVQNISYKLQKEDDYEKLKKLSLSGKTVFLYKQYKEDPISFEGKYGKGSGLDIVERMNRLQLATDGTKKTLKEMSEGNKKGGRIKYQYGGMADMSAAPMVQPRKKKKQSGFRTKYSKGGGVRATKYKI